MLEGLVRREPLLGVFGQQRFDEVFCLFRHFVPIISLLLFLVQPAPFLFPRVHLISFRLFLRQKEFAFAYLIVNLNLIITIKWILSLRKQLVSDHTKRPDITFFIITLSNDLRSNVIWSSHKALKFFVLILAMRRNIILN
jgi:hypothetical protein